MNAWEKMMADAEAIEAAARGQQPSEDPTDVVEFEETPELGRGEPYLSPDEVLSELDEAPEIETAGDGQEAAPGKTTAVDPFAELKAENAKILSAVEQQQQFINYLLQSQTQARQPQQPAQPEQSEIDESAMLAPLRERFGDEDADAFAQVLKGQREHLTRQFRAEVDTKTRQIEQQTALERNRSAIRAQHPDLDTIEKSPVLSQWRKDNPEADYALSSGDPTIINRVLSRFKTEKMPAKPAEKPQPSQADIERAQRVGSPKLSNRPIEQRNVTPKQLSASQLAKVDPRQLTPAQIALIEKAMGEGRIN